MNLRVVFMGSPEFAVPTLRALNVNFLVTGVVTQPDKPRGRGQKTLPSAIKTAAVELELPVVQPTGLASPEILASLEWWKPDVIVVAAYGKILPPRILSLPPDGVCESSCFASAPLSSRVTDQLGHTWGR